MPESSKFSPAGLLGLLRSPVVIVLLALVVGVVVIWKLKIVEPTAIAAGVIVLLIAAGLFFGGIYLARRRDKRAVDATIAGMTDSINAQDNSPQARERVAKLRGKWEQLFKNVRAEYVKNKPILMIVGESKSGKSVLLDRSGLELESGNRQERDWEEGTENVDPWFFPDGLVLDTAGEMVAPAAGSARIDWGELVKLIRNLRPRNPVSGVILAVPVWRLLSDDENARIVQANLFQREFQRLVQSFGVRFPVSVVVTMADLVDGYSEFALRQSAARPGDKYTMLGWPQYQLSDEFGGRDVMAESVTGITARLEAQVLHDTCNPETASVEAREALEIWCFPRNMRSIGQRLADYLKIVFKEKQSERVANAPFFRGVFFGSSMQSIRKGEPRRKEPERPRSEPFNIRDLIAIRLFGEAGLVTTSPRAEAAAKTRRLVGVVVPVIVAAFAASIALIAFDLAGRVAGQKAGLQKLAARLPGADGAPPTIKSMWLDADGDAAPAAGKDGGKDGGGAGALAVNSKVAQELVKDFSAARGFKIDELPVWLVWYRGFADRRTARAEELTHRAWSKLVAKPLLERAAEGASWANADFAYRSLALMEKGGGAPVVSAELAKLDGEVVAALKVAGVKKPGPMLRSMQAASDASDAEVAEGASAQAAPASSGSLTPLLVAMTGGAPAELGKLLESGSGWTPPTPVAELAEKADGVRVGLLEGKVKPVLEPLVKAAETHELWLNGKVDWNAAAANASANAVTWNTVKEQVWGYLATLEEAKTSPGGRFEQLKSAIETNGAASSSEAWLAQLVRAGEGDGASGKSDGNGSAQQSASGAAAQPSALAPRVKKLEELFQARSRGYEADVEKVLERRSLVAAAAYKPGEMPADLMPLPKGNTGGQQQSAGGAKEQQERELALTQREQYLAPATDYFHDAVRVFIAGKVAAATVPDVGTPKRERAEALFAPIADFEGVAGTGLPAKYAADKKTLESWVASLPNELGEKQQFKAASGAALKSIDDLIAEVGRKTRAWQVVKRDAAGVDALADALVKAVLQKGSSAVGDVQLEIATQVARQEAAPLPAAKRLTDDHKSLEKAIEVLIRNGGRDSDRAAEFVAGVVDESNEAFKALRSAIKALDQTTDGLSQPEREYWDIVLRSLLVRSAEKRDKAQASLDRNIDAASERFPLAAAEGEVVPASQVLEMAKGTSIKAPAGGVAIEPRERGESALESLFLHAPTAKNRDGAGQKVARRALDTAKLLCAGADGALPPEGASLRLTIKGTGDCEEKLREIVLGKDEECFAEADNIRTWDKDEEFVLSAKRGGSLQRVLVIVRDDIASGTLVWEMGSEGDGVDFRSGKAEGFTSLQAKSLQGGPWAVLRLVQMLKPVLPAKGADGLLTDGLLTDKEGRLWGLIPTVRTPQGAELSVAVGLKLEWVWNSDEGQKSIQVPIDRWIKKMNESK